MRPCGRPAPDGRQQPAPLSADDFRIVTGPRAGRSKERLLRGLHMPDWSRITLLCANVPLRGLVTPLPARRVEQAHDLGIAGLVENDIMRPNRIEGIGLVKTYDLITILA